MNEKQHRQLFLPIAVVEHHMMSNPDISIYDICDGLGELWEEIKVEAQSKVFTLSSASVLSINKRVAYLFGERPSTFESVKDWAVFVDESLSLEAEPTHSFSWLFSALYWKHLTRYRLSTTWLYVNAMRLQYGLPEYRLTLDDLGEFLESLSGSGPPIYDGQTFCP